MTALSYDAPELDRRLRAAIPAPALRLIFTGPPGAGKTVVLASVPVPESTYRLYMDMEDSAAYVDAGKDGQDVYLPRKQRFRMERIVFPTLAQIGEVYNRLKTDDGVGAFCLDNMALFQDVWAELLTTGDPKKIREGYALINMHTALPMDSKIKKWAGQRDPEFWTALKLVPKRFVMLCLHRKIHFVASTEEGNIWVNYGSTDPNRKPKVVGKKADMLKTWGQYTDAVIFLRRDANKGNAPIGGINPLQPKVRMQGLNPSWPMDWPGFVAELEAALTRGEEPIPAETYVSTDILSEEPEGTEPAAEERIATPPTEPVKTERRAKPAAKKAAPDKAKPPDWPTIFWTHIKGNPDRDAPTILGRHQENGSINFEAACRELGIAPKED